MKIYLLFALSAVLTAGCKTRTIEAPGGYKYISRQFANQEQAGRIHVKTPDGTEIDIEQYGSDQSATLNKSLDTVGKALDKIPK